jgi:hypothetical protein
MHTLPLASLPPLNAQTVILSPRVAIHKVFCEHFIAEDGIIIPNIVSILADCRPASERALHDALVGIAPASANISPFDPTNGPFQAKGASLSHWVQSLDFLRDIQNARIGSQSLLLLWLQAWLSVSPDTTQMPPLLHAKMTQGSTKTQRLNWRARRILNCLAHALAIVPELDAQVRHKFWARLLEDIGMVCAPTGSFWAQLTNGFDPLSTHALWLRAVAIVAIAGTFEGLLRADVVTQARAHIGSCVKNDGLFDSGSITTTVSAAADLFGVAHDPAIKGIFDRMRAALALLRHRDGALVTFAGGARDHIILLQNLIGTGEWKRSGLLLSQAIVVAPARTTDVWLRGMQQGSSWGSVCEIGVDGTAFLTNSRDTKSAIGFSEPATVTQTRAKRRDEPEAIILETNSDVQVGVNTYRLFRQIRISLDGRKIDGEDTVTCIDQRSSHCVTKLCFLFPTEVTIRGSQDGNSALLVLPTRNVWRLRVGELPVSNELSIDSAKNTILFAPKAVNLTTLVGQKKQTTIFSVLWKFCIED